MDSTEVALISSILDWGLRPRDLLLGDGIGFLLPKVNALPFIEDPDVFPARANVVTTFEGEETCFEAVLTTQLSKLSGITATLPCSGTKTSDTREERLLLE